MLGQKGLGGRLRQTVRGPRGEPEVARMATRMNIAVRGLFATPVAALEVPNAAEALNEALSAADSGPARDPHPRCRPRTRAVGIPIGTFLDWASPCGGTRLIDVAKGIADQMTADRQRQSRAPLLGRSTPGPTSTRPATPTSAHYHAGVRIWSGTYYVDDGGCASDHSLGGEFEMLDPRGPGPGHVCASSEIRRRGWGLGGRRRDHPAEARA